MVRLPALVLLSLAISCGYSARFVDCAISCTAASGCPGGFTCGDEGLCRAAGATSSCAALGADASNDSPIMSDGSSSSTSDAPHDAGSGCPGDLDCDGVPDGSDNCPTVANADQGNEDGDRFGDVCDPCPPYADADPIVDSDGDGVSDACDPRPTTPGDAIALFEGFHHGVPSGWFVVGSGWAAGGSDDVIITGGAGVSSLTVAATWPNAQHETVTAALLATTWNANDQIEVGVVDDYAHGGSASGAICVLASYFQSPTIHEQLELLSVDAGAGPILGEQTFGFYDQLSVVSLAREGSAFDCRAIGSGSSSADASGTSALDEVPPEIGLQLVDEGTVARAQWIMVVSHD